MGRSPSLGYKEKGGNVITNCNFQYCYRKGDRFNLLWVPLVICHDTHMGPGLVSLNWKCHLVELRGHISIFQSRWNAQSLRGVCKQEPLKNLRVVTDTCNPLSVSLALSGTMIGFDQKNISIYS